MRTAFFQMSNTHGADCGDPPLTAVYTVYVPRSPWLTSLSPTKIASRQAEVTVALRGKSFLSKE